jgi:sugar phosphate isomerase/epimerase
MMKLGFVSAILPELSLEKLADFSAENGFDCIEAMCWPAGKAERRYAGVTHVDAGAMNKGEAARINDMLAARGVTISGLGYYPNPLDPNREDAKRAVAHIRKVIRASSLLGVNVVNTFIGRDPSKTVDANWPAFKRVWKPLVKYAEDQGVRIGIENCPMLFSNDEWPGGKNLAISPAIWRRMFNEIPSKNFGLNFDPSHLILQGIDPTRAIYEFSGRFVHVHAKDLRINADGLYDNGILGFGWNAPKLPGLGDVDWSAFFAALTDVGYQGPVAIEVEDRAYEGTMKKRKEALIQTRRFLKQYAF